MQKATFLSCFFLCCISITQAQFDAFQQKIERYDSISTFDGRERIFVHYDKPQYTVNDTLWMKGYIVAGALNMVNDSSRIAYVEFIDANGNLVKRISALCGIGLFYSNITLGDQLFAQGMYTLRAYTNRMRNFGDSLFFESFIKVIDPKAALWKATLNDLSFTNNKLFISAGLKSEDQSPIANSSVDVSIKSNNKTVFRRKMVTDADGNIYIDTLLKDPKATKNLRLEITNKKLQLKIPVPAQNQQIDLQFLPEGGSFITGYKQRVGFKAVDIYGKGADVNGLIKDNSGKVIDSFRSVHNGMGYVWLQPVAGQTYMALLENGSTYPLPLVEPGGYLLQVDHNEKKDSIVINVRLTPDHVGKTFFITGSTRGTCYLKGMLKNKPQYDIKVASENFPSGVARFTIYNEAGIPVNEQAIFVWHNDALKMNLQTNKPDYINKDSVLLSLSVKNKNNEQMPGSFSIAVIDTSQVELKTDAENILSYMLLSAELKGKVEAPYYYIRHPYSEATKALMLTQAWVRYVFKDTLRKYDYEKEFAINGNVTNLFNKPSPNTKVTLFGRQGQYGVFFKDTVTDATGSFSFQDFPVFITDSISTLIKAVNRKEKSFGVGIDVITKEYPELPESTVIYDPNSIIFDTAVKKSIDRRTAVMEQLKRDGRYLEEVFVTAKARIPDSKNLNEDGGADQTITQAVLEQTPKKTLFDLLHEKVPGFRRGTLRRSTKQDYFINTNRVRFIFDGVDLNFFFNQDDQGPKMDDDYVQFVNTYIRYYAAEDVKGIEIMNSPAYNSSYKSRYLTTAEQLSASPVNTDFSFVEITTYGGVGPFLKKIPGMYLLKPNAPFVGKQFYSPRYTSPDEETVFPDLRQTVYWNSDIVTDRNGEAKVSFYTSESKGSYLIIIQGTDLKGSFGTLMAPLHIKRE